MTPTNQSSQSKGHNPGRPRKYPSTGRTKKGLPDLTSRQQRILDVIKDSLSLRGYPPSMREIAQSVGLSSTSSVSYQLEKLEELGYLRREDNKPRAVNLKDKADAAHNTPKPGRKTTAKSSQHSAIEIDSDLPAPTYIPVIGSIAAGNPILAEQHVETQFPLPKQLVGSGTLFLLHVIGESMKDAGILNGDWVVVRSQPTADFGDIVAAMIEDEATVKEYHKNEDGIWLQPHNDEFNPIPAENATILGKVTAVLRKM